MDAALDQLPDDVAALKAIILSERAEAVQLEASVKAYEALVQALKIRIAKLRRQKFGQSSEKITREIEQLELALEALEAKVAADDTGPAEPEDGVDDMPSTRSVPRRRGKPRIPDDAPRERDVLDPGEICPDCGGTLRLMGEDISEILEFVAAKLKVVETVRLKKSCRACESEGQARHWSECGPERLNQQFQHAPSRAAWPGLACWRTSPLSPMLRIVCRATGRKIRRPPSSLQTGGDLRPAWCGHSALDADRLVRPGDPRAQTIGGADQRQRVLGNPAARR